MFFQLNFMWGLLTCICIHSNSILAFHRELEDLSFCSRLVTIPWVTWGWEHVRMLISASPGNQVCCAIENASSKLWDKAYLSCRNWKGNSNKAWCWSWSSTTASLPNLSREGCYLRPGWDQRWHSGCSCFCGTFGGASRQVCSPLLSNFIWN